MRGRGLHGHSARVLTPHPGVPAWARVCRCVTPCVRRVLSVSRSLRGREAAGWGYHPPGPHWQLSSRPPTPCHGQSPLFSAAQQPLPGYFASRLSPGRGSCPPPLPAAADHRRRCCPPPLPTTPRRVSAPQPPATRVPQPSTPPEGSAGLCPCVPQACGIPRVPGGCSALSSPHWGRGRQREKKEVGTALGKAQAGGKMG